MIATSIIIAGILLALNRTLFAPGKPAAQGPTISRAKPASSHTMINTTTSPYIPATAATSKVPIVILDDILYKVIKAPPTRIEISLE